MTSYFHYDLHSLRLFIVVAELGSLTRAADRTSMTLSAVSKRIADLERSAHAIPFRKRITRIRTFNLSIPRVSYIFVQVQHGVAFSATAWTPTETYLCQPIPTTRLMAVIHHRQSC